MITIQISSENRLHQRVSMDELNEHIKHEPELQLDNDSSNENGINSTDTEAWQTNVKTTEDCIIHKTETQIVRCTNYINYEPIKDSELSTVNIDDDHENDYYVHSSTDFEYDDQPNNTNNCKRKPFKCEICNKQIKSKYCLLNHMARHNNDYQLRCKICGKGCVCQSQLTAHERIHTGEKPFACDECPMKFPYRTSLKRHRTIHSAEKQFECNVCLKRLATKDALKYHQQTHNEKKPYSCDDCSKTFIQKRQFENHINRHHKSDIIRKNHTKEYVPCDECPKQFQNIKSLNLHKQNHAQDKRFRCVICSMDFSIRYQFMNHMNAHDATLYQCQFCLQQFKKLGNLKTHEAIQHNQKFNQLQPHKTIPKFNCNLCEKLYQSKSSLIRHLKTHSTASYIQCELCPKQIRSTYFNTHMKLHMGIMSYKCIICSKIFQKRARYELHKKLHLNEAFLEILPEIISID